MDADTPRLGRHEEKAKITIYFDKEVEELYRLGKHNGWDVCEIARRAVTDAIKKHAQTLRQRALKI